MTSFIGRVNAWTTVAMATRTVRTCANARVARCVGRAGAASRGRAAATRKMMMMKRMDYYNASCVSVSVSTTTTTRATSGDASSSSSSDLDRPAFPVRSEGEPSSSNRDSSAPSSSTSPPPLTPPNASQRRVIDQMITLRTRLNERVHKANAYSKFLEKQLAKRDEELNEARRALSRAALESETLRVAASDLQRQQRPPTDALVARLDRMSRACRRDADLADAGCSREVPVTWRGNASDVRLMGDFDDWTRGFHLSPEWNDRGDGVGDVFSCVCVLPPGTYQVKFLVDDQWRTTDDWETVGEGFERNMLLRVE